MKNSQIFELRIFTFIRCCTCILIGNGFIEWLYSVFNGILAFGHGLAVGRVELLQSVHFPIQVQPLVQHSGQSVQLCNTGI